MNFYKDDVKNPVLREYLDAYAEREIDFLNKVTELGLEFDKSQRNLSSADAYRPCSHSDKCSDLESIADGIHVENGNRSLWRSWISPACLRCRKGVGTATFLISTQCPRDCWFCFNPNQVDCERLKHETNDVVAELKSHYERGARYVDLALTGGEPLLHKDEVVRFFAYANELYPDVYTRLYTSGAYLDESMLRRLQAVGLDEIRFSVKTDDEPEQQNMTLGRIRMARNFIPHVMVEMPVMPDEVEIMKSLLVNLNDLGISGVNLLELCFPLHNAAEFARRGYMLKYPPMRVFYDYWYAGGLPIAGSEEACLQLLEFAATKNFDMGVHYCSLENKYTGQIYLQNRAFRGDGVRFTSTKDYFIKSAKAFGADAVKARELLADQDCLIEESPDGGYVEFAVAAIPHLRERAPDMELGIGWYVAEVDRFGKGQLKELDVRTTTVVAFDLERDF